MTRQFLLITEDAVALAPVAVAGGELIWPGPFTQKPDEGGAEDNHRERDFKKKDSRKSSCSDAPHDRIRQCPAPDPNDGDNDDRHDSRLQSVEDGGDPRDVAVGRVNETEHPKHKHRRNDKESASYDAAPRFVQKPADIDRELLRFRAGEQN